MRPVRIESSVWSDPRYDILAAAIGCDRYSAIGRMAFAWGACTEQERDTLSLPFMGVILGVPPSGVADALEGADLGERVPEGVRIKGCEGRIEWLKKKRASGRLHGKKGGRPRVTKGSPFPDKRVSEGSRRPTETPPTPTPTLTPTHVGTHVVATSSPRSAKVPPEWALALAEVLADAVRKAWPSEPALRKAKTVESWGRDLDLLVRRDGVSRIELESGLAWYSAHVGGDFVPEIRSGKALRAKWGALQAAIKRSERLSAPQRAEDDIWAAWDRAEENERQMRSQGLLGGEGE